MTRYRTIVADPPWMYEDFPTHRGGKFIRGRGATERTALPYPGMPIDHLAMLPITELAQKDAWLLLWATSRYLGDAFRLAASWGFEYRQTIVWHKTGTPTPFAACLAPNHAEFLLVCKRGKPERLATWPTSVITAPIRANVDRHSQKPEVFLDMAETCLPGPRLELFARRQRLGWDTWGDEALPHVEMAT